MKITLNKANEMEVVGVGHLLNGITTVMYHTDKPFDEIAKMFNTVTEIVAERPVTVETYIGSGVLVGINRNASSDTVSVAIQGLTKTVERRNK